jgi:hypothetical protein
MKKIFLILFFLLEAFKSPSQKGIAAVSWEINFPNVDDYLTKTSYRGGKAEYRKFLNKNFSVGVAFSWAGYEQYIPSQTYEKPDEGGAVTTDVDRVVYQVPISVTGHFYPSLKSRMFRPFIGLGLGGQYLAQHLYFNAYSLERNNWGVIARPELGTLIRLSEDEYGVGVLIGGSYQYASNQEQSLSPGHFSNIGLQLGITIGVR